MIIADGEEIKIAQVIRVFNRDFVDASVFSSVAQISPIFYFGADSVEKQKKIEEAREDLRKKSEENLRLRQQRDDADAALDRYGIDQATRIRELLSSPGKNAYNNYDKRTFKTAAEGLKKGDYGTKLSARHDGRPEPRPGGFH